jgi:hypothetical protein
VEVEGLLPVPLAALAAHSTCDLAGRTYASTTPLSPFTLQPVLCVAVACVWLWCCCILVGVRGQLRILLPYPDTSTSTRAGVLAILYV